MSTQVDTYKPQALVDLEARAGASDQDREAWLAERRSGLTATGIKELWMRKLGRKSYSTAQEMIDEKLGRVEDTFTGNKYTRWGVDREPVIAAQLAGEGFTEEHRVFGAAANSCHLASPDGLAFDFDENLVLLEIKTAGYDLPPGSAEFDAKGYEFQCQWQMYVCGAQRVRFVVEERIEEPDGSFSPGPLHRHWVERDDELIAQLIVCADEFLAELERQRAGEGPVIDEEVDTHALNYLRAIGEEKTWAALKKSSYTALIEAGISQESGLARVTFTPGKPAGEFVEEVVDLEAAEAAHPKETATLARAKKRVEKLQAEWDALANEHKKSVVVVSKGTAARVTVTAGKETK